MYNLLDNNYKLTKGKENFDYEEVKKLFTDYFKDYDYILGDYSYGKVRLKGFYDSNNKKVKNINDIKYLDKYIKEYCSPGSVCGWRRSSLEYPAIFPNAQRPAL